LHSGASSLEVNSGFGKKNSNESLKAHDDYCEDEGDKTTNDKSMNLQPRMQSITSPNIEIPKNQKG